MVVDGSGVPDELALRVVLDRNAPDAVALWVLAMCAFGSYARHPDSLPRSAVRR